MEDLAQIKLQRKLKEKEKREAEFNACLQDISEEALLENIQPTGKIDAEKVGSSVKSLCEYLLHAIEVEQCIYKTEKRMRTLFEDIPMIERSAKDAIEKYGLNAKVDVAKEDCHRLKNLLRLNQSRRQSPFMKSLAYLIKRKLLLQTSNWRINTKRQW